MYVNPYRGLDCNGPYVRASFHTHTGTGPGTCGSIQIDDVLSEYQRLGYGALCISNHNLYTDPSAYRNRYDICLLHGYEYTMDKNHMVCAGTREVHLDSMQGAIDRTVEDGGFVILCHPHWEYDWSLTKETIDGLHGFAGVEIYNGSIDCGAIRDSEHSNGRCNAPDAFDYLLSQGRLCWCFGNDDFHRWWYLGIAWNIIFSGPTEGEIVDAVKSGAFYASTGLFLERFELDGGRIEAAVRNNEGYRDSYRYRFIGKDGQVLKEHQGRDASYELSGNEMYVRMEAIGSSGKMLYTQPIFDEDRFTPENR